MNPSTLMAVLNAVVGVMEANPEFLSRLRVLMAQSGATLEQQAAMDAALTARIERRETERADG